MKKWYDEEYTFTITVVGYLRGDSPEHLCRNGEEIGRVTRPQSAQEVEEQLPVGI